MMRLIYHVIKLNKWNGMEWNRSNGTESIKCVVVAGADAAAVEGISVVFLYDVNI